MNKFDNISGGIKDFIDFASTNIYLNDTDKAEVEQLFQKINRQMCLYVKEKDALVKDNKKYRHDCITRKMHKDEYKWLTSSTDDSLIARKERIRSLCNDVNLLCKKYKRPFLFGIMSDEELDEIAYYIASEIKEQ